MRNTRIRDLALGLAMLAGCDETDFKRTDDASAIVNGEAPNAAAAVWQAAVPGDVMPSAAYDQCYHGCYTARTNGTNRETCKLECDGLAENSMYTLADEPARKAYESLRGCLVDCWEGDKLSETNRATCRLTCVDDATIATTPLPRQEFEVVPGTVLAPDTVLPPGVVNSK